MVLGYHFIFSAYGFWLPNDPRGSWSDVVREFELLKFGPATKVTTTRSLAHRPHDHKRRLEQKQALRYPPVIFTGTQALAIARGFARAAADAAYNVHALAILPDHAHVVIARHARHIDEIAKHLKACATKQMSDTGQNPMSSFASPGSGRKPSPWARKHWCPFITSREHMLKAVDYVERNPIRAGLRAQRWSLIVPYRA